MADSITEVIDEPFINASLCSFHLPSSEPIKYYYKLKYPEVYSLPSTTVLDMLNNEQVLADLNKSVDSFIKHVTESVIVDLNRSKDCAKNCREGEAASPPSFGSRWGTYQTNSEVEDSRLPIHDNRWGLYNLNSEITSRKKETEMFKIPASTDFSVYDSVHSIEVPLRTYKKKARAGRYRGDPSVAEVTSQMSGLVFDRIEKAASIPKMGFKNISSAARSSRKDKGLSFTPYTKKQFGNATNF